MAAESRHVIEMSWYLDYRVETKNDVHVLEIGRADLALMVINTAFDMCYELPYVWYGASLGIW